MKNQVSIFILCLFSSLVSCQKENVTPNTNSNLSSQILNLPYENLSQAEKTSLLLMREEEKLARDVYRFLYDKWKLNSFTNISSSEQQHTESVRMLLNKYGLEDPAKDDSQGVFTNPIYTNLYLELTKKGSESLVLALTVGATIEDLDLYDLQEALKKMDNQDIRLVYENLSKGSRNHLRSFYGSLQSQNASYEPQFISKETFEAIINSSIENGN